MLFVEESFLGVFSFLFSLLLFVEHETHTKTSIISVQMIKIPICNQLTKGNPRSSIGNFSKFAITFSAFLNYFWVTKKGKGAYKGDWKCYHRISSKHIVIIVKKEKKKGRFVFLTS